MNPPTIVGHSIFSPKIRKEDSAALNGTVKIKLLAFSAPILAVAKN
jgi:hypothetical protein